MCTYRVGLKRDLRILGLSLETGDKATFWYRDYRIYALIEFLNEEDSILFYEINRRKLRLTDRILLNKMGVFRADNYDTIVNSERIRQD